MLGDSEFIFSFNFNIWHPKTMITSHYWYWLINSYTEAGLAECPTMGSK